MFANFLKRLTAADPEPLTDTDARLALGALLVRVARADEHYDADEAQLIERLLATRYNLTETDAFALRQDCEVLEGEAPDTVRFTRAIKDAVPHVDRLAVIESLWDVVLSDGIRDSHENSLLRLVANLLGVSDVESAKVRQKVQAAGSPDS